MHQKIKAALLHFATNMWVEDYGTLKMDYEVWKNITNEMARLGYNTLLIDVGDGVVFDSCPEIALEGSFTKEAFKKELARLKEIGLTPYPKLNFSAGHDTWLKEYSYMIGTKKYYEVCKNLIEETIDLFEGTEFIQLGMDEEIYIMQHNQRVGVVRTQNKRIEDMNYFFDVARAKGVRPWIWVDPRDIPSFGGEENFRKGVGTDVLVSNWYYDDITTKHYETGIPDWVKFFNQLADWGYEQIPTTSIWGYHLNSKDVLRYCENHVPGDSMKGYMIAPWLMTTKYQELALMTNLHNFDKAWKDEVEK